MGFSFQCHTFVVILLSQAYISVLLHNMHATKTRKPSLSVECNVGKAYKFQNNMHTQVNLYAKNVYQSNTLARIILTRIFDIHRYSKKNIKEILGNFLEGQYNNFILNIFFYLKKLKKQSSKVTPLVVNLCLISAILL